MMFDLSVLILRLFTGLGIVLFHGWGKIQGIFRFLSGGEWKFVDTVASIGFPIPGFFAILAGLTEFIGGMFLIVGFLTRISAGFLSFVVIVAIYFHIRTSTNFELPLIYLGMFLSLIFSGAGKFSIDSYMLKRR
ncbi:MAG: DoxX family protein [Spirochaetia bacterium]|nr:DoxX family protein [Spirochaetota bacterium]MDW8113026.1 DoxX family protein [Spirochaetia bacterium]